MVIGSDIKPLTEDEVTDLRREFNLSPAFGSILALLISQRYITEDLIKAEGITADGSAPKVAISRLRRRMNPFGIKILSMRNLGYWLTPATKEVILSKLPSRVTRPTTTA